MEVMPNAMRLMALAAKDAGLSTDGTIKSLMKLMEQGKVAADVVMPHFAKRMREAASGGLEKALNSNRVAMGRLMNTMQQAGNIIFESGWGEGLTDLFNELAKFFKENSHTWKAIGKTIGGVFKGIAWVVDNILEPAVSALGSVLNGLTELFGNFTAAAGVAFSPVFWAAALAVIRRGLIGVAIAMSPLLLKFGLIATAITFVIGLLEELAEFFAPTGKRTLLGKNINDIAKPIEDLMNKIKELFDFLKVPTHDQPIPAGSVEDARMRMYGGVKPISSLGMGVSGYGASATVSTPVTIQLDSKVIAEAVVTSPVGQEGVKKIIHQARPF
ncbi:hypothetical protein 2017DRC72_0390 [Vibrio phage ICP1]|nr:hypothetical protein 2017DRC72_0390 [Vibrio phage ICP1]QVV98614.1 hypothetical protein 2017DRC74_0390 [Vibrio phage ICP1]